MSHNKQSAEKVHVASRSGWQLLRRVPLPKHFEQREVEQLWNAFHKLAASQARDDDETVDVLRLAQDFVAPPGSLNDGKLDSVFPPNSDELIARQTNIEQSQKRTEGRARAVRFESTPFFQCFPGELLFIRLTRRGTDAGPRSAQFQSKDPLCHFPADDYCLDLLLDTNTGLGSQPWNVVQVVVPGCRAWRDCPLAVLEVLPYAPEKDITHVADDGTARSAPNVPVTLIMDFGNTGTAMLAAQDGKDAATRWELLELACPFVHSQHKTGPVLKASTCALHVPADPNSTTLYALGHTADNLIQHHPNVTYNPAPKKFVRDWTRDTRGMEPSSPLKGIYGSRHKPVTKFRQLELGVSELLNTAIATYANPKQTFPGENRVAQCRRILLTHPLTWRHRDKEAFRKLVERVASRLFVLPGFEKPVVEFVCSEPVAVAAYVVWESLVKFGLHRPGNFQLARSFLGLTDGSDVFRMLILDFGGGSSDFSMLEIPMTLVASSQALSLDGDCEVRLEELETMRFNCAGDRISHFIATAILKFLREKFGFKDDLDLRDAGKVTRASPSQKRQIVSHIARLAEAAKPTITQSGCWVLDPADESRLLLQGELGLSPKPGMEDVTLRVDQETLATWMLSDTCASSPSGRAGFADILKRLGDMIRSLRHRNKTPHLVVLSGRTTRLKFIRDAVQQATDLPPHRVRTLAETLPLTSRDYAEIEKLAVVLGAHRMRCGGNLTFTKVSPDQKFHQCVGFVEPTAHGPRLGKKAIICKPGESAPKTVKVTLPPRCNRQIGWSFDEDGTAEVIGTISSDHEQRRNATITLHEDLTVDIRGEQGELIVFEDCVPGGEDLIADNFNDSGRIDQESPKSGFISELISRNQSRWLVKRSEKR